MDGGQGRGALTKPPHQPGLGEALKLNISWLLQAQKDYKTDPAHLEPCVGSRSAPKNSEGGADEIWLNLRYLSRFGVFLLLNCCRLSADEHGRRGSFPPEPQPPCFIILTRISRAKLLFYCRKKKVPTKVGVEKIIFRALGSLLLTTQRRKTTVVVYTLQTLKGGV